MVHRVGIVAGHSHAICLGMPFQIGDGTPQEIRLEFGSGLISALTGAWPRDDAYWDKLTLLAKNRTVFLFWKGNQHIKNFLFEWKPPFDLVLTGESSRALQPDALLIPEEMIRTFYLPSIKLLGPLLHKLRQAAGPMPVVCGTPAPKADDDAIRRVLRRERDLMTVLESQKEDVHSARLTAAVIRYKLWRVLQDVMKDVAENADVAFFPVPSQTLTVDGFLRPEYWADDVTHANKSYGRVVVQALSQQFLA